MRISKINTYSMPIFKGQEQPKDDPKASPCFRIKPKYNTENCLPIKDNNAVSKQEPKIHKRPFVKSEHVNMPIIKDVKQVNIYA